MTPTLWTIGYEQLWPDALVAEHGISYEHRRELGTPLEIREVFRAGHVEEAAAAYRAHAEVHAAEELDALAAELESGPRTALLCLEANPAGCHRRVVGELLAVRRPGLVVVDL